MGQHVYSVRQVNTYIKTMFAQDYLLSRISVQGEISNCKYHSSGHIYFSLKEEQATIACVMFAGQRKGLAFHMQDGDRVVVSGSVSVYERDGRYQLYAKEIKLQGAGLLYERFLALKQELEEMGMFSEVYKQPIPTGIRTLGVVTSPTGAAIRDICSVARRRNPGIRIILYPALVQGEGAAPSIVQGIQALDAYGVDTLIVGRGGGSIEDLWAFNEETVARAVFECSVPVISAVGHETDVTIVDYVADLRAPTPSAAAELAVDDMQAALVRMKEYQKRMEAIMTHRLALLRQQLGRYRLQLSYAGPRQQIREKHQFLSDLEDQLRRQMEQSLTRERHRLQLYIQRLKGLSPLEKLNRGFAYAEDEAGRALCSICQVQPGQHLTIHVRDGQIQARAEAITEVQRDE